MYVDEGEATSTYIIYIGFYVLKFVWFNLSKLSKTKKRQATSLATLAAITFASLIILQACMSTPERSLCSIGWHNIWLALVAEVLIIMHDELDVVHWRGFFHVHVGSQFLVLIS